MKPNLLIVDDEEHTREGLELALDEKYEVFLASSAEEAFNALDAEKFEVYADMPARRSPGWPGRA